MRQEPAEWDAPPVEAAGAGAPEAAPYGAVRVEPILVEPAVIEEVRVGEMREPAFAAPAEMAAPHVVAYAAADADADADAEVEGAADADADADTDIGGEVAARPAEPPPTPRYAVLFITYVWDDFVERRYQALCQRVGAGDVYVFLDVSHGDPGPVNHPRVLRVSDDMLVALGLAPLGMRSVVWHNGDYPMYYLFRNAPRYDYYVRVEYDAAINTDVDALLAQAAAEGLDYIAEPIDEGTAPWYWSATCADHYKPHELQPDFIAVSVYSAAAVAHLFDARRRHTLAYDAERPTAWPLSEGFVGSEMRRSGLRLGAFSSFGGVDHFKPWPPVRETELSDGLDAVVVHPVLDGARYAQSLIEGHPTPEDVVLEDDVTLERLRDFPVGTYAPALLRRLSQLGREDVIDQLVPILFPTPETWPEVSRGKPARQSSLSRWSAGADIAADAGRAVNGRITGGYAFHTEYEDDPWWMVDLQTLYDLREIRIYNRLGHRDRAAGAVIEVSRDGRDWEQVHRQERADDWGGADGNPLVVMLPSVRARYVRVTRPGYGCLHLDQVQVFGTHVA
ncbi:fucolectin tachylectin-4 pentraxin-1 [Acidisphaera rubrifaciens HS-AP3]|uniref:Fucolectin tachylectin-4 pentraxin-1 n=2 Tax=Acidisphaera TaxID=50714 RepID=A0A0D6P6R7_9PROT|nr:fucolectin tachylectin-4 pentraxin-1 [Acidisphaera rubrifaciens HS-AP3]